MGRVIQVGVTQHLYLDAVSAVLQFILDVFKVSPYQLLGRVTINLSYTEFYSFYSFCMELANTQLINNKSL